VTQFAIEEACWLRLDFAEVDSVDDFTRHVAALDPGPAGPVSAPAAPSLHAELGARHEALMREAGA
jgi:hypothetical protein